MLASAPLFQNDDSTRGMCACAALLFITGIKTQRKFPHGGYHPYLNVYQDELWESLSFLRCAWNIASKPVMESGDAGVGV